MPKLKPNQPPKLCRHPSGRAYVRLNGKQHYLGTYGTPEATQRYGAMLAEMAATGLSDPLVNQPKDITVAEGLEKYVEYAKGYYGCEKGKTGHIDRVKAVALCAMDLYRAVPAADFGPLKLRAVQAELIRRKHARGHINSMVGCLKLAFKWLASHELIPASVPLALTTVPGLRAGKTDAKESARVCPVATADIEAVLERVAAPVAGMIRLQLATAARPGEIVGLRPCDVDTGGDVWTIRLVEHKTAHRGKTRTVYVGPKGQEVLRPFLLRDREAYCFSPKDSAKQRAAKAKVHRRAKQKPNPRATERVVGDHYNVASYRQAIARACEKAEIAVWRPNQLRHVAATEIRRRFGLEAAQVVLGHSKADTTEIYAETDTEKAKQAVRVWG